MWYPGERAQTVLMPLIMRRRKDATIVRTFPLPRPSRLACVGMLNGGVWQDGEPILKLLPRHIELVTIDFSKDERDVSPIHQTTIVVVVGPC